MRARQVPRESRGAPRVRGLVRRRDRLAAGLRVDFDPEGLERLVRVPARRLPAAVAAGVLTPSYSPPPRTAPAYEGDPLSVSSSQLSGQRASPRICTSG